MKVRYEQFGGIVASGKPPFLAFVDRAFIDELGFGPSPLWQGKERVGLLTAPTEVHLCATNRCPVRCDHCYMGSGEAEESEADTATFKKMLDTLAKMGVFHVALGGGEALTREDFFELAQYARDIGLVPNLTTSGVCLTRPMAEKMDLLGQVNISVDGIKNHYGVYRGADRFEQADLAIDLLVKRGIPTGINTVLGKNNFEQIEKIVAYAAKKGVNEVEFLRLKPAGRGATIARANPMTHEQNIGLWPLLSSLMERYDLTLKIDCSFIPMLCYHKPSIDALYRMGTYGCEAGNVLLGIRSNGKICGCSFLKPISLDIHDLKEKWYTDKDICQLRSLSAQKSKPCSDCAYLSICKGGCAAVSLAVCKDMAAPDPDCPMVVDYMKRRKS